MRPAQRRKMMESVDSRAVYRDGLSEESYDKLKSANGTDEIQAVLLEIFQPSEQNEGE